MIDRHVFVFNPDDNGGEAVSLTTVIESAENGELVIGQVFEMQSYLNSAAFTLCGASLTPDNLRKLANDLESFFNRHK